MTIQNVLSAAKQIMSDRARTVVSKYRELVRTMAAGGKVPPGDVIEIVESAGKTFDQLRVDMELVEQRKRDAVIVSERPAVEAEMREVGRLRGLLADRRKKAIAELNAEEAVLIERHNAVALRLSQISSVEPRLRNTCPDESLLARERELTNRKLALLPKFRELQNELYGQTVSPSGYDGRIGTRLRTLQGEKLQHERELRDVKAKAKLSPLGRAGAIKKLESRLAELETEIKGVEAEAVSYRERHAALKAEMATIDKEQIEIAARKLEV